MDTGHQALIYDLSTLLDSAEKFEFHDYRNNKYPLPKSTLIMALESMIIKAKNGAYDN